MRYTKSRLFVSVSQLKIDEDLFVRGVRTKDELWLVMRIRRDKQGYLFTAFKGRCRFPVWVVEELAGITSICSLDETFTLLEEEALRPFTILPLEHVLIKPASPQVRTSPPEQMQTPEPKVEA